MHIIIQENNVPVMDIKISERLFGMYLKIVWALITDNYTWRNLQRCLYAYEAKQQYMDF